VKAFFHVGTLDAVDVAARRRAVPRRRDDFEQDRVDREQHVLEAVIADGLVAIADVEPHHRADV